MYRVLRSLLFLIPPEPAHTLVMGLLEILSQFVGVCAAIRRYVLGGVDAPKAGKRRLGRSVDLTSELSGLILAHPVGLAAGLDKNGEALHALFGCGFSAVEVGTVTPRAQPGNPKPRMFRLPEQRGLINRMGFNNAGTVALRDAVSRQPWRPGPLGINIGKNKDTPLDEAISDFVACVEAVGALGDYVVVNASSPNTPGLRALQEPEQLHALLSAVQSRMHTAAPGRPLFLKFAPDLGDEAIDALVDVATSCQVAGLIATNTTVSRPVAHRFSTEAGGLSGAPLRASSTRALKRAAGRARGRLSLVGVGGVMSAEDVYEKLRSGASLVQVYTGFIYEGPFWLRRLLPELERILKRDGHTSVREVIGLDVVKR